MNYAAVEIGIEHYIRKLSGWIFNKFSEVSELLSLEQLYKLCDYNLNS